MKTFRWSTTLLILSMAAVLLTLSILLRDHTGLSMGVLLGSVACVLVATVFGKQGV